MRNSAWSAVLIATIACLAGSVVALAADAPVAATKLPAAVAADLNGDGKEDFVLDTGSVNCDGAASIYGDREKWVGVYAGDGKGGAPSAFVGSVSGVSIEGAGPAARLWLTVSGGECGKKPATKKFDYAPVATVRMIE